MVGKKLRILFVADVSPTQVNSGSERVLYEHMIRLAKRGHEVHCLSRAKDMVGNTPMKIGGVSVHHFRGIPQLTIISAFFSFWSCRKKFSHLLKNTTFDLINFQQPLSAISILTMYKSWKTPKVYTFHSLWFQEYEIRITENKDALSFFEKALSWFCIQMNIVLRRIFEWICLKSVNQIVALSEFSKKQLIKYHGISASKIYVIPGGADSKRFFPVADDKRIILRKDLGLSEGDFLLLTVRNLEPRMGLENLIKAISMVVAREQDVYLVIGGAGLLEKELKSLTNQLGLEQYIRFEGFIPDDILPQYYQIADLFILPTKCMEGFGLVTVEALACGTPVLGTPVGGTVEILTKLDPNLLFNGTEAKDMTEKILQFLSLPREDLSKLRDMCHKFVLEHYTWDRAVQKLIINF